MPELDHRRYWDEGHEWSRYLEEEVREHRDLWTGMYTRTKTPEWALEEMRRIGGEWKLLVISEDWCGDASSIVPVVARFAEAAPGVELRVVKRDENPELMDQYLTGSSRSIPVVVVLDREWRPVGWWGPRPSEMQAFILGEKRAGLRPAKEIYRDARAWYARDRGESTLREVLAVIARSAGK